MTLAARGWSVLLLNPPDGDVGGIRLHAVNAAPGLDVVAAPRVATGQRCFPGFLRRWLEAGWLSRLEQAAGCRILVLWLFDNSRFFDTRFAGSCPKIGHQVDLNQDFNPATAAVTADIFICTTDFIRDRLQLCDQRTFKIRHGLASNTIKNDFSAQQDARFGDPCLHALSVGNLDIAYLGAELLAEFARTFPAVCYHLIDGYDETAVLRSLIRDFQNVTLWGNVASELIPSILARADVQLITYKAAEYTDKLTSAHEFMEYLPSGKTILSTYTDEYADERHLLNMVDDAADYFATFGRGLSFWNENGGTSLKMCCMTV